MVQLEGLNKALYSSEVLDYIGSKICDIAKDNNDNLDYAFCLLACFRRCFYLVISSGIRRFRIQPAVAKFFAKIAIF